MTESVKRFYDVVADDYRDQYTGLDDGYPANLRRLEILLDRARDLEVRTVLDCGCGEGSPMRRLHQAGIDVWGFDFAPHMVDRARELLAQDGLGDRVWEGDILDPGSFRPRDGRAPRTYDLTIAMGVLPHVADEVAALRNMSAVTRPGGRVMVEFRNELFALYTLNRYSYEFFAERLMRLEEQRKLHPEHEDELRSVADELRAYFRLDLPRPRTGDAGTPGYDAILSRFHNPDEIGAMFERAGLRIETLHYYHFHALPPLFEAAHPALLRRLSLELEADPTDWRGRFMASAFVAEAVKPSE